MASNQAHAVDLYIASYEDESAAEQGWKGVKDLAKDDAIDVDGMLLVRRNQDGKIVVQDDAHDVRKGVKVGAVAGAVVGLIFPPSLLGGAIAGALAGAGIGGLRGRGRKHEIRADVEHVLPENTSGIIVLVNDDSSTTLESALSEADNVTKHAVDEESAASIKAAVAAR
jgi:uncharacterized membrane protein